MLRENKFTPAHERYINVKGRKYYYMNAKEIWKECTQGRYNIMLANNYTVKYEDS